MVMKDIYCHGISAKRAIKAKQIEKWSGFKPIPGLPLMVETMLL